MANFGGFAAPDRNLVFDLNDFGETTPAAWEWDIKRLAASFAALGRDVGFGARNRREVVLAAGGSYRQAMRQFAGMRTVEVWYARLDLDKQYAQLAELLRRAVRERLDRTLRKGRRKDSLRAFSKLTQEVDGEPRIVSDPLLIVPMSELTAGDDTRLQHNELLALFEHYRGTLPVDSRRLLADYEPVDLAHKVVGIGSVGMEAWIVLLLGNGRDDPLFLQIKEAELLGARAIRAQQLTQKPRTASRVGAAPDPGRKRCPSRLAPPPEEARRAPAPLLRPPALGCKDLSSARAARCGRPLNLRRDVWMDAGTRPRPDR